MRRAVFFDRDNTLNEDPGYLHDPDKLRLKPFAAEALRKIREAGYLIIVVSNQSGVGRGFFTVDEVKAVNSRLAELLETSNAAPDAFYYCPHAPEEGCDCRKPRTGMLDMALADFDIDVRASFMVGDKISDIEFGDNCGMRTVLITEETPCSRGDYCVKDLKEASERILSKG